MILFNRNYIVLLILVKGAFFMNLKHLNDTKLKKLIQIAPNKSISDIFQETLTMAESEGHFRELARDRVEQMQEEIKLIMSYLEGTRSNK
jgi:hypothetical protein